MGGERNGRMGGRERGRRGREGGGEREGERGRERGRGREGGGEREGEERLHLYHANFMQQTGHCNKDLEVNKTKSYIFIHTMHILNMY